MNDDFDGPLKGGRMMMPDEMDPEESLLLTTYYLRLYDLFLEAKEAGASKWFHSALINFTAHSLANATASGRAEALRAIEKLAVARGNALHISDGHKANLQ